MSQWNRPITASWPKKEPMFRIGDNVYPLSSLRSVFPEVIGSYLDLFDAEAEMLRKQFADERAKRRSGK